MEKLSTTIIKEGDQTWRYNPNPSVRGASLYSHGISWPPRSYSCSFCKREFRSAQALGGHMNVHRRDRARLRQYSPPSPWESPLINPNPLPNLNPNSSAKISIPNLNFEPPSPIKPNGAIKFSTFGYTTSLVAPIPFFEATKKMRDFMVEANNLLRENETRRFELEIDSDTDRLEDGLDLELRLGFA